MNFFKKIVTKINKIPITIFFIKKKKIRKNFVKSKKNL